MNDKLVDSIQGLTAAATKVAPEAWRVAVQATFTDAAIDLAGTLVIAALAIYATRWAWGRAVNSSDSDTAKAFIAAGFAVAMLIFFVSALADIQHLVNPEYHAALQLLSGRK
jgi:hypothetical protein